jgi:hypothetical protein
VVVAAGEEGDAPAPRLDSFVWPLTIDDDWCGEFHVKHEPVF